MAKNSLESRLTPQGDIIIQLNKTILSLQQANAQALESFNAKEAALLQEIQKLREQNEYLTKKLFGKSSEKSSWDMEGQMNLFNLFKCYHSVLYGYAVMIVMPVVD